MLAVYWIGERKSFFQLDFLTKSSKDLQCKMVELQHLADGYANAEASTSATTLEDLEFDDDREVLILFASQTGSAQDVAEFIAREAWRRHFSARVMNVQDFDKVDPSLSLSDCC